MFTLIFRIAIIILIHIILFAAYPDTGKFGNLYFFVSIFCWSGLLIFVSRLLNAMPLLGKFLSTLAVLIIYGITIASTAYLMPQTDKVSAYDKAMKGNIPNWQTFKRGLLRFGVDADDLQNKASNAIEKNVDKAKDAAVKEIEKNKKEADAAKKAEQKQSETNQDGKSAK